MAKTMKPKELMSNEKIYKDYYRKNHSESAFRQIWITLREYGFYIIPIFPAYLLIYNVFFGDGGNSEYKWAYIICGVCLLVVDAAAYFLVKLLRKMRFIKHSQSEVSLYKGNVWYCPLCANKNNLLAPCKKCGVYPTLIKTSGIAPEIEKKAAKKKNKRKEYEEYVPQFK